MLGLRGCRLSIVFPGIVEMQVGAIIGAAAIDFPGLVERLAAARGERQAARREGDLKAAAGGAAEPHPGCGIRLQAVVDVHGAQSWAGLGLLLQQVQQRRGILPAAVRHAQRGLPGRRLQPQQL